MKTLQLGEVIDHHGMLFVVSGFSVTDGVIVAFTVKPFIGDPDRVEDINAALAWTRG